MTWALSSIGKSVKPFTGSFEEICNIEQTLQLNSAFHEKHKTKTMITWLQYVTRQHESQTEKLMKGKMKI